MRIRLIYSFNCFCNSILALHLIDQFFSTTTTIVQISFTEVLRLTLSLCDKAPCILYIVMFVVMLHLGKQLLLDQGFNLQLFRFWGLTFTYLRIFQKMCQHSLRVYKFKDKFSKIGLYENEWCDIA